MENSCPGALQHAPPAPDSSSGRPPVPVSLGQLADKVLAGRPYRPRCPQSSARTPSVAKSVLILPLDVRSRRYLASSGWEIRLSSTLTRTEDARANSASPTLLSISRPAACFVVSAVAELDSCRSGRAKVAPPRSLGSANSRALVCASVSTSRTRFSSITHTHQPHAGTRSAAKKVWRGDIPPITSRLQRYRSFTVVNHGALRVCFASPHSTCANAAAPRLRQAQRVEHVVWAMSSYSSGRPRPRAARPREPAIGPALRAEPRAGLASAA